MITLQCWNLSKQIASNRAERMDICTEIARFVVTCFNGLTLRSFDDREERIIHDVVLTKKLWVSNYGLFKDTVITLWQLQQFVVVELVDVKEIQIFETLILHEVAFVAQLNSSVRSASLQIKRHFLVVFVYISSVLHYYYIDWLEKLRFESEYSINSCQ